MRRLQQQLTLRLKYKRCRNFLTFTLTVVVSVKRWRFHHDGVFLFIYYYLHRQGGGYVIVLSVIL